MFMLFKTNSTGIYHTYVTNTTMLSIVQGKQQQDEENTMTKFADVSNESTMKQTTTYDYAAFEPCMTFSSNIQFSYVI